MNRRRFLLALGLMVVAALGVDEAVTEAESYPEPGDLAPPLPVPATETLEVASSHGIFVGDDIVIRDLTTGVKEFFVITSISGGTITGYIPGD
jgi:hypothetical protein